MQLIFKESTLFNSESRNVDQGWGTVVLVTGIIFSLFMVIVAFTWSSLTDDDHEKLMGFGILAVVLVVIIGLLTLGVTLYEAAAKRKSSNN